MGPCLKEERKRGEGGGGRIGQEGEEKEEGKWDKKGEAEGENL